MIFTETRLPGAYLIDPERREDERGVFARVYCESEFREHGLTPRVAQGNVSWNPRRGTRGGEVVPVPVGARTARLSLRARRSRRRARV